MSSIQISPRTLEKLTHESVEIRLRALEQVAAKLERALALNEKVDFKAGDLCTQLIRWFGYRPIKVPLKVLNILKSIIQSPQYRKEAIDKFGVERFIKEVRKLHKLMEGNKEELQIVNEIKRLLKKEQKCMENKSKDKNIKEELEQIMQSIGSINLASDDNFDYNTEDYEIPWSSPTSSDYTSMKIFADILKNPLASLEEVKDAVNKLQLSMVDFPAEYLLQAPHIFRNLLHIYDERNQLDNKQDLNIDCLADTFMEFLYSLEKRLKMKTKSFSYPIACNFASKFKNSQTPCQLKVAKALALLIETSAYHLELHAGQNDISSSVWEVIFKVVEIFKSLDCGVVDIHCLYRVALTVAKLSTRFAEIDGCARLRLHQMQLIFLLQDVAQINGRHCTSLEAIEIFEPILRDYSLKSLFPQRYQQLSELLLSSDKALSEKYQLLDKYEKSVQLSIKMLMKSSTTLSCKVIIEQGFDLCLVLDKLQSTNLVDLLLNGIIEAIPLYLSNPQLKSKAIDLILKLLQLEFMPLKRYTYEKLTVAFKRHIGCLMNGEWYLKECSNCTLLENHIVGVPLNSSVLLQIMHDSFECAEEVIQINGLKILELILQSRSLFGAQWCSMLPMLVPLMPLLTCFSQSGKIMDLLLKLYDPDLRHLPYVTVLQGNLGFLFHSNAQQRSEAITRLVYTLNSLKDSENYLPNLVEISDTLPNDLCLLRTPREYRNIFNDHSLLRSDVMTSLNNLLQLLESPDVDPLIRKTTLMQINVLCSSWQITGELCKAGASYLILQALENSLQQSSCFDYADSAVPAISILNKVLLYDSSVRCELAETPNIYVLLLRALMMYHNDIQVRQDATMCLFQLLFASQLIATETSVEGPLLLGSIQIPLNINLRSALTQNTPPEPEKITLMFASSLEETQYWRLVIAATFCGSLENVTQKTLSKQLKLDVRDDLKITSQDVRFIRATQPDISMHRLLKAAANATDHRSLIDVCRFLKQQLLLARLNDVFTVSPEFSNDLNNIFGKYLQQPPGNSSDSELYVDLLDLMIISLKIPLAPVVSGFAKILLKDTGHAFITLITQIEDISPTICFKITSLLQILFSEQRLLFESTVCPSECSTFYSNLFDLFIERCWQLFELRQLDRVRCLISLLAALSSCHLQMPDQLLFFYCRRFAQLSLAMRSTTQTGAQLHRHCLMAILQLSNQMQNASENFRLSAGFVKYLSGLCGHNDVEVRILSWSLLHQIAKTTANESTELTERKSSDVSGREMLLSELDYLPGGFMACCLSTLLDTNEIICVRQLAGQLMVTLIRKQKENEDIEKIEKILEQHQFFRLATEALTSSKYILSDQMPSDLDPSTPVHITTCDLISCYTLICIEVSLRSPVFLMELCKRSFVFKLYEIMKQPPPSDSKHLIYLNMIAHICRLYAMCYADNFVFLQRTICRDAVWLNSFCQILFQRAANTQDKSIIVDMLQLLMVLFKDTTALEQLCTKMCLYSTEIVQLFKESLAIENLNTRLQRCSLSVLSLLLIKSQPELDKEQSINILTLFESQNVLMKPMKRTEHLESDKENSNAIVNIRKKCQTKEVPEKETINIKSSISQHVCIALIRLFNHLYPIKACKFIVPPNANQQHVIETMAILLKQSPVAQETANDLKLHEKVVNIFKHFFEEFSTTSCTTYVKRHGENKKIVVIKNLQLMFQLILNWHSSPAMMITDDMLATELSRIIIQIWPWLAHSGELKLTVLQVSACLSERSFVMCRQFSILNTSPFAHSVLQLIAKQTAAETLKIKAASTDCSPAITAGLRVLMNCCSCVEARTALNKAHTLNIFESLYPFNPKATQLKSEIINAWLEFWELYSRYDEGAQSIHLNSLCSVINKSVPASKRRLLSLRVLRNMTFLIANRSALVTSTDFIYTVNEIISQPLNSEVTNCSVEEQFIVCVALWKLISGGIKFVAMIRGTKLAKNLRVLRENLTCTLDENIKSVAYAKDLLNVLDIIFKIFNN